MPIQFPAPFALRFVGIFACLLLSHSAFADEFDALLSAKKYAEVERIATAKLAADPNDAAALLAKVNVILSEGKVSRLDEGAKLAEQCISAHPNHSECHEALGNTLGVKAQKGGIMSAIGYVGKIRDSFKKAIEVDPQNFSARGSLMQFYLQAPGFVGGGTSKAKELIAETTKINAAAATLLQGTLDLSQDQYERAIAAAKGVNTGGVAVLARQQRSLLTSAGHAYLSAKKPLESEKVFQELMARYPDFAGAYYGMGRALHEQGKSKEAVLVLEKALGMETSAMTLYRLGQVWQTLGEKPKAITAFEKALAFKPEINPKARSDAEEQLKALKA